MCVWPQFGICAVFEAQLTPAATAVRVESDVVLRKDQVCIVCLCVVGRRVLVCGREGSGTDACFHILRIIVLYRLCDEAQGSTHKDRASGWVSE